ncbi:class I SAM-dependent DNA methyltransferase [Kineococcus gynurae]|uniref:Class I SAM-dependent DNA methyltransferase n=1 Tax=Kineococcus gynurae TaxID=452979 RepID=A0ABV5LVH4_9ACTN
MHTRAHGPGGPRTPRVRRREGVITSSSAPSRLWARVARDRYGTDYARGYAARFDELAAEGEDLDGEARLVRRLLPPPARVLDAGCGTGRVSVRLAGWGYDVVGCDVDATMVEEARARCPGVEFHAADLAGLRPAAIGGPVDLVLLAGNVVPLLEPGSLVAAAQGVAAVLRPGGVLLAGFGLGQEHLPEGCPPLPWAAVEDACRVAGLRTEDRWSTWAGDPAGVDDGYVVARWRREG